jgi:transglutaminase-like putative cysteine protease
VTPALAARFWLVIPLVLVLAPHALRLPIWLSLAWLVFALLSLYGAGRRRPAVARLPKALLTLAGVAAVVLQYGTVIGPSGGVALLAFLSGAKLLEVEADRDRLGLLFVGIFLLVAHFLDAQSMATAAWMVVAAVALAAGLIATQSGDAELATRPSRQLGPAGLLLLQALPVALLLFLLFPRIQGPLWGLPQQMAAHSGLSDQMSPGDISQLILSNELAFRAEFPDLPPLARLDSRQLYWRGPVLWDYDGRTWRTTRPLEQTGLNAEGLGAPVRYVLTLEPHHQRWLYLLGLPQALPAFPSTLGADLQWLARDAVTERRRYELAAYLDYRLDPLLEPDTAARALDLPEAVNPRARALARGWRQSAGNDATIVDQALALFRHQAFFYTLAPPPLGVEAVDDFLFGTRRGFCEHYASAFVFLMRAAGVPARVVTGYQGGEYNQLGNYWIVRGKDAHAWAEVWLEGRGWVRVDPTAAVAPQRVERGLDAALPAAERPAGLIQLQGDWLRPLRLGWDLVNNRWNQWVLGYNHERQRQLLARLSPFLSNLQGMVTALVAAVALALGLVALALFRQRRPALDAPSAAYARFCARLGRLGLRRGDAESPEAFARRAAEVRPDLAGEIDGITRLYLAARYGKTGPAQAGALNDAVRAFRPGRPLR